MNWLRHTDYHNSRSYADTPPKPVVPGPMLTLAWLIDATRRAAAKLLSPIDRRPERMVLRRGHSDGFTLLGAAIAPRPAHERAGGLTDGIVSAARLCTPRHPSARSTQHAREAANDLSSQFVER